MSIMDVNLTCVINFFMDSFFFFFLFFFFFFLPNFPGVAILGEKDKSLADAAVAGAVANSDASFVDDFNRLHPQNWSPSHICVWWTNIAEIAFHAGVKESQKIPKTFTIEIHASDAAVEMSEEGKEGQEGQECVCKLGMKFQKEPTNKAPRLNDLNVNALVGIAMKIRGKENKEKMKKGCVLVGINEIQFDGQSNIHNQRSIILSAVKPIAMELGKAAAEWQSWSKVGKHISMKPKEMIVILTFQTSSFKCPRMPAPIPNIFTGASRLGTSDGRQLCQEFGTKIFLNSTFNQMKATGGINTFIGTIFWNDLRQLMNDRVVLNVVEGKEKEEEKVNLQNCSPTRDVMYTYQQKKKTTKTKTKGGATIEKAAAIDNDGVPAYQKLDIQYE